MADSSFFPILTFFFKFRSPFNSHAIAGGFSPAIATFLYNNYGLNAAGLVYVVFGALSVIGIYINYFCGRGNKESDTGVPGEDVGSLEMQEGETTDGNDVSESAPKDTPEIV